MREEKAMLVRRTDWMRYLALARLVLARLVPACLVLACLVLACLGSLAGCIIGNDPVRVESFAADPAGTFVFTAQTNTVMTPNDDGEAEQIRRDWLAQDLTARGMCPAGYVIDTRQLVEPPDAPLANAHDVVYSGRCL